MKIIINFVIFLSVIFSFSSSFGKGYCAGIVHPCSYYNRQYDKCMSLSGCTWISGGIYDKTCNGTSVPCNELKKFVNNENAHKTACDNQPGCYWVEEDSGE